MASDSGIVGDRREVRRDLVRGQAAVPRRAMNSAIRERGHLHQHGEAGGTPSRANGDRRPVGRLERRQKRYSR